MYLLVGRKERVVSYGVSDVPLTIEQVARNRVNLRTTFKPECLKRHHVEHQTTGGRPMPMFDISPLG